LIQSSKTVTDVGMSRSERGRKLASGLQGSQQSWKTLKLEFVKLPRTGVDEEVFNGQCRSRDKGSDDRLSCGASHCRWYLVLVLSPGAAVLLVNLVTSCLEFADLQGDGRACATDKRVYGQFKKPHPPIPNTKGTREKRHFSSNGSQLSQHMGHARCLWPLSQSSGQEQRPCCVSLYLSRA
jgi:hypothetical protein